jgi:D-alanyl-D-alanine carboxypeptidase
MLGSFLGLMAAMAIGSPSVVQAQTLALAPANSLPQAATVERPSPPTKRRPESLGVKTTGKSAFIADVTTGAVLFAKDPHRVASIASLTKLMTAIVFLDQKPDLDKTVTLVDGDFDGEGKAVFPSGETFTQRDLLKAMLVGSVNAAANALARSSVGKEKFVELMNQKAKELNLKSPVFADPSGVNPRNRANAADVAALLSLASGNKDIREISEMPSVTVHGIVNNRAYRIDSTNLLLGTYLNKKPFHVVAAKTGSLPEAGYCMAMVTANAQGHEIVAVELGSDNHFSRYQDIKAMTTWAFDAYSWE